MTEKDQDDPNDFVLNDAINSLYSKARDVDASWKKKLIAGTTIGLILVIVLIVILIVVRTKDDEVNNGSKDYSNEEMIAEIDCIYIINDISNSVKILGEEFLKGKNEFEIYIGKNKIKYSKTYQFEERRRYDVTYKIYSKINMD